MQPSPSRWQEKEEPNFEMREERNAISTGGAEEIESLTLILLLMTWMPHAACAFFESIKEGAESQMMSPLVSGVGLHVMIPDVEGKSEEPKPHTEK